MQLIFLPYGKPMETFDSSNRISYAQQKLLVLVEARQLRSWCLESNLPHASLYKLAVGQSVPIFSRPSAILCRTLHPHNS